MGTQRQGREFSQNPLAPFTYIGGQMSNRQIGYEIQILKRNHGTQGDPALENVPIKELQRKHRHSFGKCSAAAIGGYFKNICKWHRWMIGGEPSYSPQPQPHAPSHDLFMEHLAKAPETREPKPKSQWRHGGPGWRQVAAARLAARRAGQTLEERLDG